ncbi:diguanylate cyclase domain-containing protein [Massilia sp. TS11]|uniref:diguanylate cyclase domain-containing protein n=1 Tax=Massilia sp. TS11 TaxID=2908003 RepID=UPI001EDBC00D|nr:diguanylate cyclase [Massilia sp. TS11]MCG2584132.1 diguanylate cyclase [Massilia sp. TS11]
MLQFSEQVDVLEDPARTLRLEEVRAPALAQRFRPAPPSGEALSFGYTHSAFWLRFELSNSAPTAQTAILEVANARLGDLTLYTVHANGSIAQVHTGSYLPFDTRPLRHRYFAFPLQVAGGEVQQLYLRVQSPGSTLVPLRLWQPQDFRIHQEDDHLVQGTYFGMVLAMALFNLVLFVALRDRVYALYVLAMVTMAFALAAQNGLAKQYLWPQALAWSNYAAAVGFSLAGACFAMFMRVMLEMRTRMPRLDKIVLGLAVFCALTPLAVVQYYQLIARPITLIWGLSSLFLLAVCVLGAWRRQRAAWFFLAAFGLAFLGNSASSLAALGLFPHNVASNYGTQIGSAIEMMVLAFALADRFNTVRRERAEAQRAALRAEHALVESLKAKERELEARVEERTSALQAANVQLEALSVTDSLTDLANRRQFDLALESEWARALRLQQPLAVGMIDIDDFKRYNDAYGHPAGDYCLRRLAAALGGCVQRAGDLVARYGGEEFVFIAPAADLDASLALGERLCEAVRALAIPHERSRLGTVSISVGVAAWVPVDAQGAAALLAAADAALYRAKTAGRNRVVASDTRTQLARGL